MPSSYSHNLAATNVYGCTFFNVSFFDFGKFHNITPYVANNRRQGTPAQPTYQKQFFIQIKNFDD